MSYRVGKAMVIVCGFLLMREPLLAQTLPPLEAMAEDAQMTVAIKQCKALFAVNEQEANKLFKMIFSVMFTEYGNEKTNSALDSALTSIIEDMKRKGLREWCEIDGAGWLNIRYPELAK